MALFGDYFHIAQCQKLGGTLTVSLFSPNEQIRKLSHRIHLASDAENASLVFLTLLSHCDFQLGYTPYPLASLFSLFFNLKEEEGGSLHSIDTTGLHRREIPEPHLRPTESETLGWVQMPV